MSKTAQQRLQEVLASYGADPRRWPAEDRAGLEHLLASGVPELGGASALDRLLDAASAPQMPAGAEGRLMQKLQGGARPGNVVPLRRGGAPRPRDFRWLAALPLAASLALGIYLGARGSIDSMLPASLVGTVTASGDDPADLSGMGDAESYSEDNLT